MNDVDLKQQFRNEVFATGPAGALPKNLSDSWLDLLLQQALCMHNNEHEEQFELLILAVLKILANRFQTNHLELTEQEFDEYLNNYSTELSLEKISRVTQLKIAPATLDSILTDRSIEMTGPISEFID